MLPLAEAPQSVCILRLSALGDTCHVVPLVRTLQQAWPATRLTWIIGRAEARLMSLIEGIEFITVDKRSTAGALRALRQALRGRRFDVLLHLQLALRASLLAACVHARIKLGFDRPRARELQWLFTNARIAPRSREHVLDSFLGLASALGIRTPVLRWDVPLPAAALEYAARLIPDGAPTLLISPCSSHAQRSWLPQRYAAIAAYAQQRHGLRVILCGSGSATERRYGAQISAACEAPLINQIGQDTLPQMLALLARASALLAPDSGPAHMAGMVGTPVLGLYAASNPQRSGPYLSRQWCIDQYPTAARVFRGCEPEELPWGHKIEQDGVMELISVEQVTVGLDRLLEARA